MVTEPVAQWLRSAETDLRAVEHLLREPDPVPDAASFHVQQAAEKLVKTVLVAEQVDPPKSHDIQRLCSLLPPANPLCKVLTDLAPYTALLAVYRYPSETQEPPPPVNEVRQWLVHVAQVRAAVLQWLGLPPDFRS